MKAVPAVAIGAVIGAGLRYGIVSALALDEIWSTLLVNLIGCFALGWILVHGEKFLGSFPRLQSALRPLLATGLLGGFTTTSALANQSILLIQTEKSSTALLLITASLLGGLLAFHVAQKIALKGLAK